MSPSADHNLSRPLGGEQAKRKVQAKARIEGSYRAKPYAANGAATTLARNGVPARQGRDRRTAKHGTSGSIGKKPRPPPQQSSTPAASQRAATRDRIRAQAIADLYSVARGNQVSIMDVVLDSQPVARPDPRTGITEELMDYLEERQRITMHDPSDEEILQEMFNPWYHGRRQARKWLGTVVTPVDCSSSRIYRVSAERSTVSWDSSLDSEETLSSTRS